MLTDLVEQGKIKHIGVSNFNQKQMIRAHRALEKRGLHLSSNQMEYSILNRRIESNGVLETAKELNISIMLILLNTRNCNWKFHDNPELLNNLHRWRKAKLNKRKLNIGNSLPVINELKAIAKQHNATPAQIALSWLINYHNNVFAIPGATSIKQAQDNVKALKINLSKEELDKLHYISSKFI